MKERGYKTLLERDRRFELPLSAWKADVLAADTNPAYVVPSMGFEPILEGF